MKWIFGFIAFWLLFVLSLTGWWLYFGLSILSQPGGVVGASELARHQRMLFTEGSVLMASLLIGGLALFYFSYHMHREKIAKDLFFASFTHDLKTSLFRLQLEVEKLSQEKASQGLEKVLTHTRKMQLNLENSLDSIVGSNKTLYLESVALKDLIGELHTQWPEMSIELTGESDCVMADRKALHSIFKNLLHNSYFHGGADQVSIQLKANKNQLEIRYSDNGAAFTSSVENLGQKMATSGSGFGLIIVKNWVERLGGQIQFQASEGEALKVQVSLPVGAK